MPSNAGGGASRSADAKLGSQSDPTFDDVDWRQVTLDANDGANRSTSPAQVGAVAADDASIPLGSTASVMASEPAADANAGLAQADTSLLHLDQFRADPRFNWLDGRGLSVVVLDTGIDLNHGFFGPDGNGNGIADRIVYSYDFTGSNSTDATDRNGHGSNVASIVGSQDGTFTGMAPGVNIIALKVLSDSGSGTTTDITEALNWVVANRAAYNVVAVNMSLGYGDNLNTPSSSPFASQFATLAANNTAVVVASGNSYAAYQAQGVSSPSADPNAWSVGAVWDRNVGSVSWSSGAQDFSTGPDRIISFSQRSTAMTTIFAPGGMITGANWNGGLSTYSGTSQATPHVAGLVADMQQLAMGVSGHFLSTSQLKQDMINGSVSIFDGDDENDNVANSFASYRRVDALGWANQILNDLFAGTAGNDSLAGTVVGDTIHGNAGNDTLNGLGGNDMIYGDAGNDFLNGSTGNDGLTGGTGADTFFYASGYGGDTIFDFSHAEGDKIDISSIAAVHSLSQVLAISGQSGADTIINFGGGDFLTLRNVDRSSLVAGDFGFASTQTIEAAGATAVTQIGKTYFMEPVGGGAGTQIRYNGAPWTVGQNGSWRVIGAEQISNGYSVWWQYGLADQFVQWTTDLAGNYTSNGAFLTRISYALQSNESAFQQDLNGDGTIGISSSSIETAGNTKLAQVADMYFMYQGDGSSGVLLRSNGAPWTVGQNGAWRAIGAEQTANGYSVWWRNGTADQYERWNTDLAGNYTSTGEFANGGSSALQSYESSFQQDLNGDGTIGLASSSIETVGNTKLARVADMYFMYQGDGSSGVLVRYNGLASNPGGQWQPIGAEQTANGYSVWLSSAGQFVEWNTDSNGNYVSNGSLIVGSKGYALESSEPDFQQDFNGDGTLGVVSSSIETAGNTKLAQVADMYFAYTGDGSSGVILRDNNNSSTYLAAGTTQRVLGVETRTDGDYDAMMQVTSDGYEVWQFRANGDWLRRPFPFNPFHASSFQMQDAENRFQQDFNGNGVIGTSEQMMASSGSSGAASGTLLLSGGDFTFASVQTIEAAGVTALRQIDNTYFMDPVGGGSGSGPQIRFNGAPWTVGYNGSWRAIGAEQMANGYSVWWQYGAANQFVQWSTDLAGNWVSNGRFVTRISYALQSNESTFQQDLNGDGTIGVVSSEIETAGNTKLAQVADQYFMYQGDGSSGVVLRKNGAPWTVGQDGAWRAIGAEQTANGYSVWLRNGTADQYERWNTDLAGNYTSTGEFGNGGSSALQSYESSFQQDLNGDGTIGLASSEIETAGNTKLARVADMYFMYQGDGSSGVLVRYNGSAVNPGGGWKPIGAEQTANGYSVWLSNGVGQFVEWNTDSNGNYVSNGSSVVSSKGYALESSEPDFHQDFNGDGTLGVVTTSIETVGTAKLAQLADLYFVYTGDGSSGVILRGFEGTESPQALGVEQRTDGDYDVVMKLIGPDQYEEWQFRANGDVLRRPFPFNPIHGSSFQMQDLENRYQQDFNGNGVIGTSEQMMASSGSSGADPALLLNYMASSFATPAGEGTGVVAGAQTSDQEFLTKPLA
jgi:Subtilase family/Tryptophan-rich Synechocystis species C-terminal domain/RTX calcium-binding nonapeptide repeat (4 copies)